MGGPYQNAKIKGREIAMNVYMKIGSQCFAKYEKLVVRSQVLEYKRSLLELLVKLTTSNVNCVKRNYVGALQYWNLFEKKTLRNIDSKNDVNVWGHFNRASTKELKNLKNYQFWRKLLAISCHIYRLFKQIFFFKKSKHFGFWKWSFYLKRLSCCCFTYDLLINVPRPRDRKSHVGRISWMMKYVSKEIRANNVERHRATSTYRFYEKL